MSHYLRGQKPLSPYRHRATERGLDGLSQNEREAALKAKGDLTLTNQIPKARDLRKQENNPVVSPANRSVTQPSSR